MIASKGVSKKPYLGETFRVWADSLRHGERLLVQRFAGGVRLRQQRWSASNHYHRALYGWVLGPWPWARRFLPRVSGLQQSCIPDIPWQDRFRPREDILAAADGICGRTRCPVASGEVSTREKKLDKHGHSRSWTTMRKSLENKHEARFVTGDGQTGDCEKSGNGMDRGGDRV